MVHNVHRQDFDAYMRNAFEYQGFMDSSANSIDLMLGYILEKIKIKPPKMLGDKISKFEKGNAKLAGKCVGDFEALVNKLREFNSNWIITKHGTVVGMQQDLTFFKDGKFHIFDQGKQHEISQQLTEIMGALNEIWNRMLASYLI